MLIDLVPQERELLDVDKAFTIIELQSSLAEPLQDGTDSLVMRFRSKAPNENGLDVED